MELEETDSLLRRVQFTNPDFIKDDGTPASSSFSLKKGEQGLSVDLEKLTTLESSILDPERFRLYRLKVSDCTNLGLNCEHDPVEDNPAHSLIMAPISRGASRQLAKASKRVAYPD